MCIRADKGECIYIQGAKGPPLPAVYSEKERERECEREIEIVCVYKG